MQSIERSEISCSRDIFAGALFAHDVSPEIPPQNDIFAPLLGSWRVETLDYLEDDTPVRGQGEWHFARVLEGRAIQDVWIVPARGERAGTADITNRYGTSLRIYNRETGWWRITWFNPVTGIENFLTGRHEGGVIVQTGRQPDGAVFRWNFDELSATSFTWRGHASHDDGETWQLEAEFFGRRISNPTWLSTSGLEEGK